MSDANRTTPAPEGATLSFRAPVFREQVDGGYSGGVTVTKAAGFPDMPDMVFVEAPLLNARLVLMTREAAALRDALAQAAR